MGKRDIVESKNVYIMLDKVRLIKITLRSLLLLENLYGTVTNAFAMFGNIKNEEQLVIDIIRFLFATTGGGLTQQEMEEYLTEDAIVEAYRKLREAIENDLPETENTLTGEPKNETYDWDSLYYIGRYRLQMSETEFWDSTPKRFWKLNHLWNREHGMEREPEPVLIDQIAW